MHIPFLDYRIGQAESFGLFIIWISMNFLIKRSEDQMNNAMKPRNLDLLILGQPNSPAGFGSWSHPSPAKELSNIAWARGTLLFRGRILTPASQWWVQGSKTLAPILTPEAVPRNVSSTRSTIVYWHARDLRMIDYDECTFTQYSIVTYELHGI